MKKEVLRRDTPFSTEYAVKVIPNRFEMTLVAAEKARKLKLKGVDLFRTEALMQIANGDLS
jgi:DNA-directed RNA polymerase omega subunit